MPLRDATFLQMTRLLQVTSSAARGGKMGGSAETKEAQKAQRAELRDPFSDLKAAFEPPKEKGEESMLLRVLNHVETVHLFMFNLRMQD